MAWNDGLEYLKVPQWRAAFERADVIIGVDVATGVEICVFGLPSLGESDGARVLRVSIDRAGEDLELLLAACQIYRGHHDDEAEIG
jgi:small ligand-binding sensory domain FIST